MFNLIYENLSLSHCILLFPLFLYGMALRKQLFIHSLLQGNLLNQTFYGDH